MKLIIKNQKEYQIAKEKNLNIKQFNNEYFIEVNNSNFLLENLYLLKFEKCNASFRWFLTLEEFENPGDQKIQIN